MKANVRIESGKVLTYEVEADTKKGDLVMVPPVGWWSEEGQVGRVVDVDDGSEASRAFYEGACKWARAVEVPA